MAVIGTLSVAVSPPLSAVDRAADAIARFSNRRARSVVLATLVVIALSLLAMSRLEMRGDLLDLLPARSEGAQLYRAVMRRMGGGSATLYVVVRSPDADANRRLVDTLTASLRTLPPTVVRAVERGPEEARRFLEARKWLFAEVGDLEEAECELARARTRDLPGFVPLEDETCAELRSDRAQRAPVEPARASPSATARAPGTRLPFERFRAQLAERTREVDRYPTGYFRTADGGAYLIILRVAGGGFGDRSGDALVARVNGLVAAARPTSVHPRMEVGLGGDIPNAIAERDSVVREAAVSFGLASLLILGGITLFFRSAWSLGHLGLAMFTGVGLAYALAWVAFGYLTLSTVSLGSIVAGNGINYAIVYLARYRERRGEGDTVEDALADASVTVRGGTWLSALAAAGAYGSLMLTDFRGFSQFGLIGAAGMLFCWCATMVVVPASITLVEQLRGRRDAREASTHAAPVMGALGDFTARHPVLVLGIGLTLLMAAGSKVPAYLGDPWEYNLANLQSSGNVRSGAGYWSGVADEVFRANTPAAPSGPARAAQPVPEDQQGPGYTDVLLADRMEDALPLAEAVVARDRARSGGRFVHHVETVYDALGGAPAVVSRKLALLAEIRAHIDALMPNLSAEEQRDARAWRPPETLAPIRPEALPTLVRERYTERDGRFGTPVIVVYRAHYSPSDGRKLIEVARLTQRVRLADGRELPTASRATVFAEMIRALETDGLKATAGALGAVILVVLLATRRLAASVAVITTLLGGVLLTLGGAAWTGTRLNFLNFVALPLTFGIGVDYGINLFDRMKFVGGDPAAAIRSVGGAMALCSFTTVVGYGALLSHDNLAMQSFGRVAMSGELSCLVTAIFLMPAVLFLLRRRTEPA